MTRKHFEALASIVSDLREAYGNAPADFVMREMAHFCEKQNPRFDLARFEDRCSA